MYDPNKDREEMMRKIVAAQMVAPEMVAPQIEAPKAPEMDIGAIVPPPATFNESPVIDQILANMAQNYAGPDPITPPQMGPVQRGGGMMPLNAPPMAAYGQGLGGSGASGGNGLLASLSGMMGDSEDGESGPVDWPDFLQKMLQDKLRKAAGV